MPKRAFISARVSSHLCFCVLFLAASALQSSFGSTITLNFTSASPGTIEDTNSAGTGFTTRLPGTDSNSPDSRLLLDTTGTGTLDLTGANPGSDFNGQSNVGLIEAPGINLSSLGFTGTQDFSLTATFSGLPADAFFDFSQLGLYVGTSSSNLTRDGFVYATVLGGSNFYGNNNVGGDAGTTFSAQPTFTAGDTLTATISRTAGVVTETVNGFDVTPTSNPNTSLGFNADTDLTVGAYSINTDGSHSFTADLDSFSVTVDAVPEPGTWAMMLGSLAIFAAFQRLRSFRIFSE